MQQAERAPRARPAGGISRRSAIAGVAAGLVMGVAQTCCAQARDNLSIVRFADLSAQIIPANATRVVAADRDDVMLIEASRDELDPDGKGYWWTTSNSGTRFWKLAYKQVMTPEMFGEIADGDAAPAINQASRFLNAHGGGTLRFRPGKTYALASTGPGSSQPGRLIGSSVVIPGGAKNLTYDLNGATLFQVTKAFTFGPGYRGFNDPEMVETVQPMTGSPRRGDRSVMLASPSRIEPGRLVMVVSRNAGANAYAPTAELLMVEAVQGRKVIFSEQLSKDHDNDGGPFGIIDVSKDSIQDCSLIGPGRLVNKWLRCAVILQAFNFVARNIVFEGRSGLHVRGRHILVDSCTALLHPDWKTAPLYRPFALALDTGTSDAEIVDFTASGGDGVAIIHLHEALADVHIENIRIKNGLSYVNSSRSWSSISINGSSWNIVIDGGEIVNSPQGPGIGAGSSVKARRGNQGLILRNLRFTGSFRGAPIAINDDQPATISNIDLRQATRSRGELVVTRGGHHRVHAIMK